MPEQAAERIEPRVLQRATNKAFGVSEGVGELGNLEGHDSRYHVRDDGQDWEQRV